MAFLLVALAGALALATGGLRDLGEWAPAPDEALLGSLRIAGLVTGAVVLVLAALRRSSIFGRGVVPIGFALRGALYTAFLATLGTTSLQGITDGGRSFSGSCFTSLLLLGLTGWTATAILAPEALFGRGHAPRRAFDTLLCIVVTALLVAELGLLAYERLATSPFALEELGARRRIGAFRLPAGHRVREMRANEGGYNDEEFFEASDDDLVVALVGNSFAVGVVPYELNFATIAEQRLVEVLGAREGRVAIHNFGVSSIGMPEYAWLIREEVLATRPSLVVVCVAIGGDLNSWQPRYRIYSLRYTRVGRLFMGMRRSHSEGAMAAAGHALAIETNQEWDATETTPTFSEEAYDRMEVTRLEYTNGFNRGIERQYERFFQALDVLHAELGDRLRIVVAPDEFQVSDRVWERTLSLVREPHLYRRMLPQLRILEHCRERNIPALDLTKALADAEGSGPVHPPRDGHWNVRGNRAAGEALAAFLLETLPEGTAEAPGAQLAPDPTDR